MKAQKKGNNGDGESRPFSFFALANKKCTKNIADFVQNKKISKNKEKIFKRVFTNGVFCDKLWEKIRLGK